MVPRPIQRLLWGGAVLSCAASLLLWRIGDLGIWDPWELEVAEAARRLASGGSSTAGHGLKLWLVATGFRLFGVEEWAGRLPIALCAMVVVLVSLLLAGRYHGLRAGLYAAAIAASTPLFFFHGRLMLGEAPCFAAQACVALCATAALFPSDPDHRQNWATTLGWLASLALCLALAVEIGGGLMCALPPLLAAAVTAAACGYLSRPGENPRRSVSAYAVVAAAAAMVAMVAREVAADGAGYSRWLGGSAGAGQPATFDLGLEAVFHAFAPWSALVPIALGRMVVVGGGADRQRAAFRSTLLLWIAFGYAAQTLFLSRYGAQATFYPLVALSVAVALTMRDVEESGRAFWAYSIAALLLGGLLIRDYALYPASPLDGLVAGTIELPEALKYTREWAALISIATLLTFLSFGANPGQARLDLQKPYRTLREQWRRGLPFKAWMVLLGLVLAATAAFGAAAFIAPERIGMSTLVAKWARRLAFVPIALPVAVTLLQLGLYLYGKLGRARFVPVMAAAGLFAAVVAQGFLPAISSRLSPREIFETYNRFAAKDAELAEYGMNSRAATYYAKGKVREIKTQSELVEYLLSPGRRWAALPADELAPVDRLYRKQKKEHLFVADARSATLALATNMEIAGRPDQSPLARHVISEPPKIHHPVRALLDDKIEFLGYDLALPYGKHAGAGESFTISWYFRVLKAIPGSYKMFVHIDGHGLRINGDHDPLDGKYPVRLWDQDDVIVDVQTLQVPAHFRGGSYAIYMGFFSGGTRLPVKEGPADNENRISVGTLTVR